MPTRGKAGRYHHGGLKTALVDTAIELIAEQGVRGFSMAEASRRLGVAVSAPYAHFGGRDDLLAAVAVRAYETFHVEAQAEMAKVEAPSDRLAAMARAYVRFAGYHRALFEVLYDTRLDKRRYPEIKAAEQPIDDALRACVGALAEFATASDDLAHAVEATARGHAMLVLDGDEAVDSAAEQAARATLALIEGRRRLSG